MKRYFKQNSFIVVFIMMIALFNTHIVVNADGSNPPSLTVDSPQNAQFSNGQLQIKAEASDPAGENCTIKVYEAFADYDTGTLLTQSVNSLDTIVDLTKYNGQKIVLRFEATNDSGVTTMVYRNITVDDSPLLDKNVQVDGQILDYKDNKLLYKTNNNELKIRDLQTSVDTVIYSDSVNTPDSGNLTPYGALFLVKSDSNYDSLFEYRNNKLTNLGKVDNQMKPYKVNGQYAIWNEDSRLYLINLENDQITLVSNNTAIRLNEVAPNGDVYYMANWGIYKYSNRTTSQVSLDSSQFNGYPLSNGKVTLYERYKPVYYGLPTISLILNVNGQEQVLSTYNVEFLPGVLYAIAGDYVAYTKTVNGIRQIFLLKDGVTKQITYFNSDSVIASLNENGDVVAAVSKPPVSDNYLVKNDGSLPIKLDSASIKYYWTDTGLYGSVGDSFFSIVPNLASDTDNVPPVTTDNAPKDWVNKDVTVNLNTTDNGGSGVVDTYYTVDNGSQQSGTSVDLTTEGVHTITYWSVDNAGNVEVQHTANIKIDKTAPITALSTNPGSPTGKNGWYTSDVQVSLNPTDSGGSGVANTEYRINGGAWTTNDGAFTLSTDGTYTIDYRSTDNAGNVEPYITKTIKLDKTAPVLNISLDKTTIWPANHKMVPVTATINASDATSGIDSVVLTSITSNEPLQSDDIQNANYNTPITGSTDTFKLRADRLGNGNGRVYTITFTVTDNAGNVTNKSVTVSVPHDQSNK